MNWLELAVEVENEAVESVSELLARYGYNAGVVVEPAWTPGDEGPEFSYDTIRPSVVRTYIPIDESSEDVRQRIEQGLWHLGQLRKVGPLQTRTLAEEDWANAWRQHYRVMRIGERTVVAPSWLEYEATPEDVVLRLDPGMAFGTGLHPTTQLCLRLLERYAKPGRRTLDLGTGSGILAIAAAKLGAGPIVALDNDPVAIEVAAENIAINQVSDKVVAAVGSLGAGSRMGHWLSGDFGEQVPDATSSSEPEQYDLIAANLIAKVLVILAADLYATLAPGGSLISSGIIIDREPDVIAAFAEAGLQPVERHQEGEWVALVHTRAGV